MKDIPGKPDFYYLCKAYGFNGYALLGLSVLSSVPYGIIEFMFQRIPVDRDDAQEVLRAFSKIVGHDWTFDNTKIPTIDLHLEQAL